MIGDVLLHEALTPDPSRESLDREESALDEGEHAIGDADVVVDDFALGDPVFGEDHPIGIADLHCAPNLGRVASQLERSQPLAPFGLVVDHPAGGDEAVSQVERPG